jgi:hypothetical protein
MKIHSPAHDLHCHRGKSHLTARQSITKPINEFNNNVKV